MIFLVFNNQIIAANLCVGNIEHDLKNDNGLIYKSLFPLGLSIFI